jgi:hypothetical protein
MKSAPCSGETKSHSAIIVLISFSVNPSFFPWMIKFSFSTCQGSASLSHHLCTVDSCSHHEQHHLVAVSLLFHKTEWYLSILQFLLLVR